ncbi:MAG: hypothetical protein FD149_2776 [Rhodospirillaceae bacterium]|nr:MAG: hypothetical protein FD149_2776 [Rhodospirillaceae bacterium]
MTGHVPTIGFPEFIWIWNVRQRLTTPRHHLRMARWLTERWHGPERNGLLMAFRDSGKSTLIGLFCAWMLRLRPDLCILVLAADHALAKKMVRNVKRVIERHPLTRDLKPRQREQWAADQFTVNRSSELRDPSMLAKGLGANVTGSRADVIICDDVEVPNTCDTASKRADLRDRLSELDYVLVPGGMALYVGTPHTYYTLYAATLRPEAGEERPFLEGFQRLEIPVVDTTGRGTWPERFPEDKIAVMRHRSGPNKFASQMLLRPVNIADGRLDPDRLKFYEGDLDYAESNGEATLRLMGWRLVSASCWWDPAYGATGRGDSSVVACVYTDDQGEYWLHGIRYLRHDPATPADEVTQFCRQVAAFVRDLHIPAVRLETNGIGRFLPGLLRRELAEQQVPCGVVEAVSTRNKDIRIIEAFDAVLAAGALRAHRSVWETLFIAEMREWQPGMGGCDDGLDAVSGCLLAEPARFPRRPLTTARTEWRPGAGSFRVVADFTP